MKSNSLSREISVSVGAILPKTQQALVYKNVKPTKLSGVFTDMLTQKSLQTMLYNSSFTIYCKSMDLLFQMPHTCTFFR